MVQTRSVKIDERIAKLEESFDVKFNDHKEGMKAFIQNLFAEFKEEIKKMFSKQFSRQEERINILESEKAMLQQQIISLKNGMCISESNIKEIEQYGRRFCLRIENVPVVENEISEDVFSNVLDMCKKGNINISENDIDRARRIGKPHVDHTTQQTFVGLQNIFSVTIFRLPRRLKDVLQSRLEDVLKTT